MVIDAVQDWAYDGDVDVRQHAEVPTGVLKVAGPTEIARRTTTRFGRR